MCIEVKQKNDPITGVALLLLILNFYAHISCRTSDYLLGGVQVVGVQVNHFLFGYFAHLRFGDLADLQLVRSSRTLFNAGSLLQKGGGRRCFQNKGKTPVFVDGNLRRNDIAVHLLGALVELLAKLGDRDTVLTQSRSDRRSGVGLAGLDLKLQNCLNCLLSSCWCCHLNYFYSYYLLKFALFAITTYVFLTCNVSNS